MKRLQAAMRDRSARTRHAGRSMYRVGSPMKGCAHCGDVEERETASGGVKVVYKSGFEVFRSYEPKFVGWTWWCYECGAKDLVCWAPDELGMVEKELGKPPIEGTREAKRVAKYRLRKELMKGAEHHRLPTRVAEIARLEAEVARLMEMLKGGK